MLLDRKAACKRLNLPIGSFNLRRMELGIVPAETVPLRPGCKVTKELYSKEDINKIYLFMYGRTYQPEEPDGDGLDGRMPVA